MTSPAQRLEDLRAAERDYQRGAMHAYGSERIEITGKLKRIRRQIAMLTECDRAPMRMPEQSARFK